MKEVTATDLRKQIQEVLDTVYYKQESIIITRQGKPRVIINPLPQEDDQKDVNEAIEEYIETASDIKK